MAIAFRSESHFIATGTNPTVLEPTGTANADVIVALSIVDGASSTNAVPAGWTSIYSGLSSNSNFRYNLCYVVRGASAPSFAFTHTGSVYYELYLTSFSGGNISTPIDATAQVPIARGTSISPDPPSVTAVASNTMALAFGIYWAGSDNITGWIPPAGYTLRSDNTPANDGAVSSRLLTSAGAENPGSYSGGATGLAGDYWSATITLAPIPASIPVAWFTA